MKHKQKPIVIHFVCRGNTYRSRLAAAYMDTVVDDRFVVTSSGIATQLAPTQIVESYTYATAKAHHITHGIAAHKTQTTNEVLAAADIIVFMNKDVYDEALRAYTFDVRKAQVWHVKDMDPDVKQRILAVGTEKALIDAVAAIFTNIKRQCDALYAYISKTAWVDVVDKQNHSAGLRLPIAWVTDKGLWHRGVHVIVQTADGKFVVGKRTNTIVFAPGMLEISLGGGIDSGETPLQAAQRETFEELGIRLPASLFRPLFTYQQVGYHPHYHKQTKTHLYVYAVTLPVHSQRLHAQPEEVAELRLLSKRQVKLLLRTHRVEHFGKLKWGYKLYEKAVAYSTLPA